MIQRSVDLDGVGDDAPLQLHERVDAGAGVRPGSDPSVNCVRRISAPEPMGTAGSTTEPRCHDRLGHLGSECGQVMPTTGPSSAPAAATGTPISSSSGRNGRSSELDDSRQPRHFPPRRFPVRWSAAGRVRSYDFP